jgi:hypothetical protein
MSAVIIYENQKIELDERQRYAGRIALQSDPASERLLSVALTYLDSNFLASNFHRLYDERGNAFVKDSITSRSFIGYINRYEMKIYTFDSLGRPLFNNEPASFDTLNTIFRVQGKEQQHPGCAIMKDLTTVFHISSSANVISTTAFTWALSLCFLIPSTIRRMP